MRLVQVPAAVRVDQIENEQRTDPSLAVPTALWPRKCQLVPSAYLLNDSITRPFIRIKRLQIIHLLALYLRKRDSL